MKWTKRNEWGVGCLGQGYECGAFIVEETYDDYNLQKRFGGRRRDYYWQLKKGEDVLYFAPSAKKCKEFAESLMS